MSHCETVELAMAALGRGEVSDQGHLNNCPYCQAELSELQYIAQVAESGPVRDDLEVHPPASVWKEIDAATSVKSMPKRVNANTAPEPAQATTIQGRRVSYRAKVASPNLVKNAAAGRNVTTRALLERRVYEMKTGQSSATPAPRRLPASAPLILPQSAPHITEMPRQGRARPRTSFETATTPQKSTPGRSATSATVANARASQADHPHRPHTNRTLGRRMRRFVQDTRSSTSYLAPWSVVLALGAIAAVVAIVWFVTLVDGGVSRGGEVINEITLVQGSSLNADNATATAQLIQRDSDLILVTSTSDLPTISGAYHQLWLVSPESDTVVPLGVIDNGRHEFHWPRGIAPAEFRTLEVTSQPLDSTSRSPSTLLTGTFEP